MVQFRRQSCSLVSLFSHGHGLHVSQWLTGCWQCAKCNGTARIKIDFAKAFRGSMDDGLIIGTGLHMHTIEEYHRG